MRIRAAGPGARRPAAARPARERERGIEGEVREREREREPIAVSLRGRGLAAAWLKHAGKTCGGGGGGGGGWRSPRRVAGRMGMEGPMVEDMCAERMKGSLTPLVRLASTACRGQN